VPAFEGRCTKLLGKLFRGKPDDHPYLAAPLPVRIAGPRRAAFGTVGAVKESGQTQLGGATPGGPRPVEVIEERSRGARGVGRPQPVELSKHLCRHHVAPPVANGRDPGILRLHGW
jgi:hypothetical protein